MRNLQTLREFVDAHFHGRVSLESVCTCGSANHVRVFLFRADSQPVVAIVPEDAHLSADDFRVRTGAQSVVPLDPADLPAIFPDTELGRTQIFENPFRSQVFFDRRLLSYPDLVFCPRMFLGDAGECFRVPTQEFLSLTHAIVMALTVPSRPDPNAWAI